MMRLGFSGKCILLDNWGIRAIAIRGLAVNSDPINRCNFVIPFDVLKNIDRVSKVNIHTAVGRCIIAVGDYGVLLQQ